MWELAGLHQPSIMPACRIDRQGLTSASPLNVSWQTMHMQCARPNVQLHACPMTGATQIQAICICSRPLDVHAQNKAWVA